MWFLVPQAVLSLGNIYNALESLIDATNSIAAALESEHGLGIEASDLDQQLENVKFNQVCPTSFILITP